MFKNPYYFPVVMTVRNYLRRVRRKQDYSLAESADCSTVYLNGTPRGFIPKFDRVTEATWDSSRQTSTTPSSSRHVSSRPMSYFANEAADCSAGYHPVISARIANAKEIFSAKTDVLIEAWREIKAERELTMRKAYSALLRALQNSQSASSQKYACQSSQ